MRKGLATQLEPENVPWKKMIPLLRELNVTDLRVWQQINWNRLPTTADYAHLQPYIDAGFNILCTATTPNIPIVGDAHRWFQAAAAAARTRVNAFQILNEINLPNFWKGTMQQAVTNVLQPAWQNLAPWFLVVSPSISEDKNDTLQHQLSVQMQNETPDARDAHPYGANAPEFVKRLNQTRAAIPKFARLILSEAQVHGASTSGWISYQPIIWEAAKAAHVSAFYYYCGIYKPKLAGKAGLLMPSTLEKRQPWFDTYKALA